MKCVVYGCDKDQFKNYEFCYEHVNTTCIHEYCSLEQFDNLRYCRKHINPKCHVCPCWARYVWCCECGRKKYLCPMHYEYINMVPCKDCENL